jgi:epsilon-lactone hydrolase
VRFLASDAATWVSGKVFVVGTSEVLCDDTIRIADAATRAGVDVEVEEAEGMVHVHQMLWFDLREGVDAIGKIAGFVKNRTSDA